MTQDTTIDRLMKGQARLARPGQTTQKPSLTLMNKARDMNRMFDRMNRGQSIHAVQLKIKLDQIHAALWELVEQIEQEVEVIV